MNDDQNPQFVAVADTADVPMGRVTLRQAGDREVLVCNVNGQYYAIENRCSHQGQPLNGGRLMGRQITCPFHSAIFDVSTGAPNGFPASRPIKCFATRLNGTTIEVAV